jgi:hypothetical protein
VQPVKPTLCSEASVHVSFNVPESISAAEEFEGQSLQHRLSQRCVGARRSAIMLAEGGHWRQRLVCRFNGTG